MQIIIVLSRILVKARARKEHIARVESVRHISAYYDHANPADLSKEQVLDFLIYQNKERQLKPSTVNITKHGLKTFYQKHLNKDWRIWSQLRIRQIETVRHVLTREEVDLLLGTFRSERYRAFFTTMYQCGLRFQEALNIRPKDIDGGRLLLRVRATNTI